MPATSRSRCSLGRISATPDIPTAKELGYDVAIGTWRASGVRRIPPRRLTRSFVLRRCGPVPGFIQYMANTNNIIDVLDGAEYGKKLAVDNAMFKALIDELGLKQQ